MYKNMSVLKKRKKYIIFRKVKGKNKNKTNDKSKEK
jgi:hypothetical protein